jgi:hypothetical protein
MNNLVIFHENRIYKSIGAGKDRNNIPVNLCIISTVFIVIIINDEPVNDRQRSGNK